MRQPLSGPPGRAFHAEGVRDGVGEGSEPLGEPASAGEGRGQEGDGEELRRVGLRRRDAFLLSGVERDHLAGRAGERAVDVIHDGEGRRPGRPGGGDRLDDVGRLPRLRDADDERPPEPERALVERHERRAGERDREPAGQPEGVLRVAGGVVGRAARGDQDEAEVVAREAACDPPDVRPLADEEARQDVGLLADLGAKDGTFHRGTSGVSSSEKSQAAPRTPEESPQRGGRSGVSTRSEKTHRPQRRGTSS